MGQKEYIGQQIRTMRLSRGMTLADLALAINQSQSSITMYETGRREPDFETLEALADVFNVPLVSFVNGGSIVSVSSESSEPVIRNPDIRLLAKKLDMLPKEQREQALDVFNAMYHKFFDNLEDENK